MLDAGAAAGHGEWGRVDVMVLVAVLVLVTQKGAAIPQNLNFMLRLTQKCFYDKVLPSSCGFLFLLTTSLLL